MQNVLWLPLSPQTRTPVDISFLSEQNCNDAFCLQKKKSHLLIMAVSDALGWGIWMPSLLETGLHTMSLKEVAHWLT